MTDNTFRVRIDEVCYPDQPNANGRLYPRKILESIAEQMKELADKKRLYVTNGPSDVSGLKLTDVVALGSDVVLDEQGIEFEVYVPPFPTNKDLAKMLELGMGSFTVAGKGIMALGENGASIVRDAKFEYVCFGPKLPIPDFAKSEFAPPKPSPLTEQDIMGERMLDL